MLIINIYQRCIRQDPETQKALTQTFRFPEALLILRKLLGGWSNGQDRREYIYLGRDTISRYVLPRSLPATPAPHLL